MRLMSTTPQISRTPASLPREIKFRPPASLLINPRNAPVHPKRQIRKIANSIAAFGQLVPIVIDENGVVPKGHASLDAANTLKLSTVPTVTVPGLSEERKRAFVIADNRLTLKPQPAGRAQRGKAREPLPDPINPVAARPGGLGLSAVMSRFRGEAIMRDPAVVFAANDLPPFLSQPGQPPRTPCTCQPVAAVRSLIWTPCGRCTRAITAAFFDRRGGRSER
jgi:hypothetical protein